MANIQRIRITSSGYPGAPGVTTFYALNAAAALPELKGLIAEFAPSMPNTVVFAYPVTGDIIDPLNGDLVGTWTAASRAGDEGGSAEIYAAPVGVCINWSTGDVLDGHRLTGRTFMVPMTAPVFSIDGSVEASTLSAFQGIVNAHQTALADNLVVWHRPRVVSIAHPVARAGGYSVVTSGHVPDKAVVLRSRRA